MKVILWGVQKQVNRQEYYDINRFDHEPHYVLSTLTQYFPITLCLSFTISHYMSLLYR